MLNFNSILVFSENPEKLADFYKKVFEKDPDWNDNEYFGFLVGNGFLSIGPHDKVHGKSKNPERIMINFETEDVKGEFKRIKELGAKVVAEPYQMGDDSENFIATLEDIDGNYFQLMPPWDNGKN